MRTPEQERRNDWTAAWAQYDAAVRRIAQNLLDRCPPDATAADQMLWLEDQLRARLGRRLAEALAAHPRPHARPQLALVPAPPDAGETA